MSGTRGRLEESGVHIGQVLNLEDSASWIGNQNQLYEAGVSLLVKLTGVGAVFGKPAIHCHTVGFEVLAEQLISTATVKAGTAQLGVVGDDSLADLEVPDFGANGCDHTDGLVAGNQRELQTCQSTDLCWMVISCATSFDIPLQ